MNTSPSIVWLRQDLRLQDQPAFAAAVDHGGGIIPVYIADPAGDNDWAPGGASKWWLHHSLSALGASIRARGGRLILRSGDSLAELNALIESTGATAVYWCRRYEPFGVARDGEIKKSLNARGVTAQSFNGALLHEPHTIKNKQGTPYKVFTPYWKHCLSLPKEAPGGGAPEHWPQPPSWPSSPELDELNLRPKVDWADAFPRHHEPGEAGGHKRLQEFLSETVECYVEERDFPGTRGTSRLSPHLHYGEISPRQIWAVTRQLGEASGIFPPGNGARVFLSEVGWREFAYHLMFHFPHTLREPLREEFGQFPWRKDPGGTLLQAWQRGHTGYPIVDAGMRELWSTGWMHNRVRMVVASFLVKHLRLPWQSGAEWFWDTLVDADLAANTLGWQWSAGCGADAAPYFRIFAPVLQGQKFDKNGEYVRRWIPELAKLPDKYLHAPWSAPKACLADAQIVLGKDYPEPIVDHQTARKAALAAYQEMRRSHP